MYMYANSFIKQNWFSIKGILMHLSLELEKKILTTLYTVNIKKIVKETYIPTSHILVVSKF